MSSAPKPPIEMPNHVSGRTHHGDREQECDHPATAPAARTKEVASA
jgi:hypothetical protein